MALDDVRLAIALDLQRLRAVAAAAHRGEATERGERVAAFLDCDLMVDDSGYYELAARLAGLTERDGLKLEGAQALPSATVVDVLVLRGHRG